MIFCDSENVTLLLGVVATAGFLHAFVSTGSEALDPFPLSFLPSITFDNRYGILIRTSRCLIARTTERQRIVILSRSLRTEHTVIILSFKVDIGVKDGRVLVLKAATQLLVHVTVMPCVCLDAVSQSMIALVVA